MKNIFLDTNIIVDLIADRQPFSKFAIHIFSAAEENKITLYTSSHSIATTYYLLINYINDKESRAILYKTLDFIKLVAIDQDVIKKGLKSKYKDFEDGLQIISATTIEKLDCIVTRNVKDFKDSPIPVLAPDELSKYV